jgi:hypothetical protein
VEGVDCVWLVDSMGKKTDVMYPAGWGVLQNPLRLVDPTGNVVAWRGSWITLTGPDGIGESICGPNVFLAETVKVDR